jgi:hypothetical protein
VSQENVIALLDRAAHDEALRSRLRTVASADALTEAAAGLGFSLRSSSGPDRITDADLDGIASAATDRTCYGTTDCCHTNHTCFGTTACCH